MNKKAPPPSAGATRGEVRDSSRRGTGAAPSVTPIGATLGLALNKSAPPPSGATRGDASDRHKGLTRGDDASGAAPSAGAMRGDALNRSAPPPSGATRGDFRSNSSMSVRRPRAAASSSSGPSSINASSCWMSSCSTPSSPAAMMVQRIKAAPSSSVYEGCPSYVAPSRSGSCPRGAELHVSIGSYVPCRLTVIRACCAST